MKLTNENISEVMEKIEETLVAEKVSNKNKIKICLLLEEALLRYKEKYGELAEFRFIAKKWFAHPQILIRIQGDAYNPLAKKKEEEIFFDKVMTHLLHYEGANVNYRYIDGCNEISAVYAKDSKSFKMFFGGGTTAAVLLAFLCGFLMEFFLSKQTQNLVMGGLVTPILNALFHMVIAVNIPFIFVNIVASICSIDDAASLNNLATKIMIRFTKRLSVCLIVTFLIANLFFPSVNFGFEGKLAMSPGQEEAKILSLLLSILPQNIIEPFLKGNILQIVSMAIIIGFSIVLLGNRINTTRNVITEFKAIMFKIESIVLKVMPLIMFLSILKVLSTDFGRTVLLDAWKIIAAVYLSYIAVSSVMLVKNYIKHKINPISFLKKIYSPCLITFTTGSGSASIPKNLEVCKNELHVSEALSNLYIPLSHALCPTSRLIGITVSLFFATRFSNADFSVIQLLIVAFLLIQFAVSSSSNAGGVTASTVFLLSQFGFSLDVMGIIMTAQLFFTNVSGVVGIIVRDADLYDLSLSEKV